jgi:hypothetical protein
MQLSKKKLPDLASPKPGGYWTNDLWIFQGEISSQRQKRSKFLCNLIVVDEHGRAWLGVRRAICIKPGHCAEWFAAYVVTGEHRNFKPAPANWRDFVCASLVIPLLPDA